MIGRSFSTKSLLDDAKSIFATGVASVIPKGAILDNMKIISGNLQFGSSASSIESYPLSTFKNIYVFGMGKASIPMAEATEAVLGKRITYGHIICKHGQKPTTVLEKIKVSSAGHPVPDTDGTNATKEIIDKLKTATKDDLVILLISGGGSALLSAPIEGVSLADLQQTTSELLSCGASIHEINTIRKHLSQVKGGNFAKHAYPARVVSLILSDVVGDTLDTIASGPTVPDSTTFADCKNIIEKYSQTKPLKIPTNVMNIIENGMKDSSLETPKANNEIFQNCSHVLVANNYIALLNAKEEATKLGYKTLIMSSKIEGEAKEFSKTLTAIASEIRNTGNPIQAPACVLFGGETTVTIHGKGMGGRNQEMALGCLDRLKDLPDVTILCAGTDGGDGPTDAAGALVDRELYFESKKKGIKILDYMNNNDSYNFFSMFPEYHLKPGQTGTNVMDMTVVLVK